MVAQGRTRTVLARRGVRSAALAAVVLLAGASVAFVTTESTPGTRVEEHTHRVPERPGSAEQVDIDTSLYLPLRTPAPAVLLAPGFGADKDSVDEQARELAADGFVVQTFSPRGFGGSSGRIGLNDPDREVADARHLLDRLAARPEVRLDGDGDPRVAAVGASYGGALSLMLAGTDRRVDAVVPVATYHDLGESLVPNAARGGDAEARTPAAGSGGTGVFKSGWSGLFFSAGLDHRLSADPGSYSGTSGGLDEDVEAVCGRFTEEVCRIYVDVVTTGTTTAATAALLHRLSPASVAGSITAPTLLVQGEQDTLFGLDQADATARRIASAGGDVQVVWFAGGHDAGMPGPDLRATISRWLRFRLTGAEENPFGAFEYDVQGAVRPEGAVSVRTVRAADYPGLRTDRVSRREVPLSGSERVIAKPPGGLPAAISGIPGLNALVSGATALLPPESLDPAGQSAAFDSAPLSDQLLVTGATTVRLRVSSVGAPGDGVLFAKLYDVGPDGTKTLPGSAVAPVRLPPLPEDGTPVEVVVALPGVVHPVESGHRLRLVVGTTDQGFRATVADPAVYRVGVVGALSVPSVPAVPTASAWPIGQLLGIVLVPAVAAALLALLAARQRRGRDVDPSLRDTPLVVDGLVRVLPDGTTAVDGLSLRVERGQVFGLLGPNGAGKTTTLRMLMGLITPDGGEIRVFGVRVTPGAPVLSRVGCFVEAAGFLPHLTGRTNLELHWAATGRPAADAHLAEALEIAALGDAVDRPVRTYSQGMRQRLAIARAMLGLPDLLVLDEPTNGLDPPQIRRLREVLRRYAATGRAVLVSSHLLAEVEATCTHIAIVHRGVLVADGPVVELAASGDELTFAVDRPEEAGAVLRALTGVSDVDVRDGLVHADLAGIGAATALAELVRAGISVRHAVPRRRLEDAFLRLVGEVR
ncbi:alpha/beta fold hydrolase [Umezawaea beigongshangensis]|uniref:alpha/beta fold hydrolase n=1 Tax=Umezawaea beigongshangensis TaxID=2780383 RepID=UPI0018F24DC5|nr:alpha/beta fold hydrolase [Umezawaea beigongshangensis]